jgi:hypothetical protein
MEVLVSSEPQTNLTVEISNRARVLHLHTRQRTMVQQYPFYLPSVPCPKKMTLGQGTLVANVHALDLLYEFQLK